MYTVLTNVLSIHSFILCVSVAVTNSIVKLHEGSISVFSEGEGHGCTFTVELPVLTREDIIEEGISSVSPPVQPTDTIVLSSMLEAPDPDPDPDPRYKGPSIVDAAADNNDQDEKSNDDCLPTSQRNASTSFRQDSGRHKRSSTMSFPEPSARTARLHLLMVDDSAMSRKMVRRAVRETFASVREAEDGEIGVALLKETLCGGLRTVPIDVVLMDYQMPNMDGPTATKMTRTLGFSGLIIGLTGNALPEDIATFLSHGANKVLTKPLDFALLDSAINGETEESHIP